MKISKLFTRIPRDAGWLLPGLEIKRWFFMLITGAVFFTIGLCIICNLRPVYTLINMIMKVTQMLPSQIFGWFLIIAGALFFFVGW